MTIDLSNTILPNIRRYWFLIALFVIFIITLVDFTGILVVSGEWLKSHHGPDVVIVTIFLLSGFSLSPEQFKNGLTDIKGVLLTFVVIFIAAPLVAILFSLVSVDKGILVGLFLVAVMPSTLSSGVVMTAAAGGNAAHALITTIVANTLAVFTIPYALSLLLKAVDLSAAISIDKEAIMLKIAFLVVLPLILGMVAKHFLPGLYQRFERWITLMCQCMILFIVWIALSQTRGMLVGSGLIAAWIAGMVFIYHGLLLAFAWGVIKLAGRQRGERESILFMGGQKTLPLSVILQMSLFPNYGIALLVCVVHHIVHLMMDGYLVERMKPNKA